MANRTSKQSSRKKSVQRINSRSKGAAGEREFIQLIKDYLGDDSNIKRNLEQTRSGGYDIEGVEGWAIEIKRYAVVREGNIKDWWQQTTDQAVASERKPALAYRQDHGSWKVKIPLGMLNGMFKGNELEWTTDMSVEAWCCIVREGYSSVLG